MQCNSPLTIKDPVSKVRNVVPCGKCYPCLATRRKEWTIRLEHEARVSTSAWFLTLTYTDENLPCVYNEEIKKWPEWNIEELAKNDGFAFSFKATLIKRDYQLFIKRLRKESWLWWKDCKDIAEKHGIKQKPIKYYAVGEYGEKTKRPHYHAIMFNAPLAVIEKVAEIWQQGNVKVGDVNTASIHYVTKYVTNPDKKPNYVNPEFTSISNGIGKEYIEKNYDYHKKEKRNYVVRNGHINKMPRYYSDKLFNRLEKDKIRKNTIKIADQKFWQEYSKATKQGDDYEIKQMQQVEDQYRKLKVIQTKKGKI